MKMKKKTLCVSLLVSMSMPAFAASYAFNNGSSSTAHGITDSSGDAFRSGTTAGQVLTASGTWGNWTSAGPGVLAIGIFTTDDLSGLDKTDLIAAFSNQLGSSGTFGAGPSGQRGTFAIAPPQFTIAGSVFENKNIYFFAGNGSSFADSTEFLVLKHNTQFLATDDDIPTATTISFTPSNTVLLFGSSVANVPTTNTDSSVTAGWAMAAPIPEPSAALLGALGALALLRRRRN